jgi:hypothetical protein
VVISYAAFHKKPWVKTLNRFESLNSFHQVISSAIKICETS